MLRKAHPSGLYGIKVDILQFLLDYIRRIQFDRMVVVLPNLVFLFVFFPDSKKTEKPFDPETPALRALLIFQIIQDLTRTVALPIAHHLRQLKWWFTTGNQMNMIAHKYKRMDFQAFVFLTITPAINDYIPVNLPGKKIYPANNGAGKEI